jgi:hypothetical protein
MALLRADIATYNRLGHIGPADKDTLQRYMPNGAEFRFEGPNGNLSFYFDP